MADHGVEIKKLFKEDKLVLGSTATFKKIKLGNISKVFVSKNCPLLHSLHWHAGV